MPTLVLQQTAVDLESKMEIFLVLAFSPKDLGDLKESPSLGESSHVMFSRMAKYSSQCVLHIFRMTAKSYRAQSLFASVLKFMYRAVKSTKICSVPRIFKTKCKLFMCAKRKHKTKRNNSPC